MRSRSPVSCGAFVLAAVIAHAAQQPPAPGGPAGAAQPGPAQPGPSGPPQPGALPQNRGPAAKTGTARIRGRVETDAGTPVRDADVTLSGDVVRQARSDDNGRYEFADLPAGRFYLNASKTGFAVPGQTPVGLTPNSSFELLEGQVSNRVITLARGGVIKGRVVDEFGEPIANAEMRVERYVFGPGGRQLNQFSSLPGTGTTDDRGEYRAFGLPPGEYLVSVRTRQFGAPVTMGRTGERDRAEGLLPTYYPGTIRPAEAQPVRVVPGQEVTVDLTGVAGRLARVSGTVSTSTGRPPVGLNIFLGVQTSTSSGQINGGGIAADGSFSVGNVPPGDYMLRVQRLGGGMPGDEVASMPITLSGQDLAGLHLTTRPGVTIRGRVEWEGNSPKPGTPVRVSTSSADWSPGPLGMGEFTFTYLDPENGTVRDDGTFELGGVVGNVLFNTSAPSWGLKSVRVDGKDITFTGVDAASLGGGRLVITMTDQTTNLSGAVQDTRQRPVVDYVVVLLPQRPIGGMAATRFVRLLRSDQNGAFRLRGLPAGDYVAGALGTLETGREWDPAIQTAIRSAGRPFTLTDGQTLTLNLELLR